MDIFETIGQFFNDLHEGMRKAFTNDYTPEERAVNTLKQAIRGSRQDLDKDLKLGRVYAQYEFDKKLADLRRFAGQEN